MLLLSRLLLSSSLFSLIPAQHISKIVWAPIWSQGRTFPGSNITVARGHRLIVPGIAPTSLKVALSRLFYFPLFFYFSFSKLDPFVRRLTKFLVPFYFVLDIPSQSTSRPFREKYACIHSNTIQQKNTFQINFTSVADYYCTL